MVSRKGYSPKRRGTHRRQEKKVLLIAAEGNNKTEKNYFKQFANDYVAIRFVRGNETDPVQMAKHLIEDCQELELSESDYAVCLVDSDFDLQKNAQLKCADEQLIKANKKSKYTIQMIQSAPCFEIWYICHFSYTTRGYSKTGDVLRELEKSIPGYQKGQEDCFISLLKGKEQTAIKNARKLEQYCRENKKRPHHVEFMPSTEVYKIFEEFLMKCKR